MTSEDIKHQLIIISFFTMCWKVLVNLYPSSLHAEKGVTLPLEDHVLKSAGQLTFVGNWYWAYVGSQVSCGLVHRLGIVMCQFGLFLCLLYE